MTSLLNFLFLLLASLSSLVSSQQNIPSGLTYRQGTTNGVTYEYIDWRYEGCYQTAINNVNALYRHIGNDKINYDQNSCAYNCWNNEASQNLYANWFYIAMTNGRRCFCGNNTQTALVNATQYCWGAYNTSQQRVCNSNQSQSCGGDTGAIVFIRADVGGNCATNSSGALDHSCFEIDGSNRTLTPPVSQTPTVTTTTTTTTTTSSSTSTSSTSSVTAPASYTPVTSSSTSSSSSSTATVAPNSYTPVTSSSSSSTSTVAPDSYTPVTSTTSSSSTTSTASTAPDSYTPATSSTSSSSSTRSSSVGASSTSTTSTSRTSTMSSTLPSSSSSTSSSSSSSSSTSASVSTYTSTQSVASSSSQSSISSYSVSAILSSPLSLNSSATLSTNGPYFNTSTASISQTGSVLPTSYLTTQTITSGTNIRTTTFVVTTQPSPTSAISTSSTSMTSRVPVPPPAPTPSGTTGECYSWYVVAEGDTCDSIDEANSISYGYLATLNPDIDSACDNLIPGYAYCVSGEARVGNGQYSSIPTSYMIPTTSASTTPATTYLSTCTSACTSLPASYTSSGSVCVLKTKVVTASSY